jgi:glycosyltransferase involved in cell wall biosynthesis
LYKLAIISTHPIQYYAPLFRLLSQVDELKIKVYYLWGKDTTGKKYDPGFGKDVEWDIPLLTGYEYSFVENVSKDPGTHHFFGINNPNLIRHINKWQPNALLIFGWNFFSHLKVIMHFKDNIPLYFRGDSTLLDEAPGTRKILRRIFLRWVYKHIDYAFYVGARNKEYYLAHGLKEHQLIFAPHAVDNKRFMENDEQKKQEAMQWRRKLGIKDDDFVILFAGKLEPKKNPSLLLNAFIKWGNPSTHLIIVGNGIQEEELRIIALFNVKVHFLPFQNQSIMPVVYRLGNLFVLPSQGPGETWGLSVNEAMACGLPVLVSNKVGCAVDLIRQGENGFLFKSNDQNELIRCFNKFICADEPARVGLPDLKKLRQMGLKSSRIIKEYSIDILTENITRAIKKNL